MGFLLTAAAFLLTFLRARRGLALGLEALFVVGYSYGILRARFPDGASHFVFDGAVLGLYAAHLTRRQSAKVVAFARPAVFWTKALCILPLLLFFVPLQHPLIQLVGLRAAVFFLPLIIIGARLEIEDLERLARSFVVLNLVAFAFAVAEFVVGVPTFYPRNAATELIYRSTVDTASGRSLRIPATFTSSAAFGGAMLMTLPLLIGRWNSLPRGSAERHLTFAALALSALGIFLSASRSPVVILLALLALTLAFGRLPTRRKLALLGAAGFVILAVLSEERLQRFATLSDAGYVESRLAGSINMSFLDAALEYPLGAGLGRGGTTIPFFLSGYRDPSPGPLVLENEYGRIVLEQGVPGLVIWLFFVVWTLRRSAAWAPASWRLSFMTTRALLVCIWASAAIGVGILAAVPHVALLMIYMGLFASERGPASSLRLPAQHATPLRAPATRSATPRVEASS